MKKRPPPPPAPPPRIIQVPPKPALKAQDTFDKTDTRSDSRYKTQLNAGTKFVDKSDTRTKRPPPPPAPPPRIIQVPPKPASKILNTLDKTGFRSDTEHDNQNSTNTEQSE